MSKAGAIPIAGLLLLACCSESGREAGIEKVKVISRGAAYSPKDYLIPGRVAILVFYADW